MRVYYWRPDGQLLGTRWTPDSAVQATSTFEFFVEVGTVVVTRRLEYVNGVLQSDGLSGTARDPVGLPLAAASSGTSLWQAEYGPFGEILSSSGDRDRAGPWGFTGHLRLAGSAVRTWDSGVLNEQRPDLYLTNWRAYDPMVGQFTSAEPVISDGTAPRSAQYSYALSAPLNFVDPTGEEPEELPRPPNFPFGDGDDTSPWHEPEDVVLRCRGNDSCEVLAYKILLFDMKIRAHVMWDWIMSSNRHAREIQDLRNGLARCERYYNANCNRCRER